MNYETSLPINCDPSYLLFQAKMIFVQNNFKVNMHDNGLEFSGPGIPFTLFTNQLAGISQGTITIEDDTATFEAELAELTDFQSFVYFLMLALLTAAVLIPSMIMDNYFGFWWFLIIISPLVVFPYTSSFYQKRKMEAIDQLLENINTQDENVKSFRDS